MAVRIKANYFCEAQLLKHVIKILFYTADLTFHKIYYTV